MEGCAEFRKTLLLDVYDELPAEEQQQWQDHLLKCSSCRSERQRLKHMLVKVKETGGAPELSRQQAARLKQFIVREVLGSPAEKRPNTLRFWGIPLRPVHALIALGVVVLTAALINQAGIEQIFHGGSKGELLAGKTVAAEDLEVIENLDLLENIEDIEGIVRVVDRRNVAL
ncbi:MAG: hypothetical protein JRJ12_04495 [Deltaproteobacteria bacterium]|nr:hypothetical protein [Deltaproteobacteria bacterium]MBW2070484.1 hypothetical protein [Deltaproteobacteria bacterium]